jgi:hypothetical protein
VDCAVIEDDRFHALDSADSAIEMATNRAPEPLSPVDERYPAG